jgi:hypothetical protein
MEATMRKFFLMAAIVLSAGAAHAGPNLTVASADAAPTASPSPSAQAASPSAQLPDAGVVAAKRQAMMQQKMAMQKQKQMAMQMAMQRQMQLHPIRTRVHFALLRFKQKLHQAF